MSLPYHEIVQKCVRPGYVDATQVRRQLRTVAVDAATIQKFSGVFGLRSCRPRPSRLGGLDGPPRSSILQAGSRSGIHPHVKCSLFPSRPYPCACALRLVRPPNRRAMCQARPLHRLVMSRRKRRRPGFACYVFTRSNSTIARVPKRNIGIQNGSAGLKSIRTPCERIETT